MELRCNGCEAKAKQAKSGKRYSLDRFDGVAITLIIIHFRLPLCVSARESRRAVSIIAIAIRFTSLLAP
jgi:hypothetical protein